jgi:hypothetical protein
MVSNRNYHRESIYLTESERAALERLARDFNTSKNGIIKILIRDAAGLPLPAQYLAQLRESAGLSRLESNVTK